MSEGMTDAQLAEIAERAEGVATLSFPYQAEIDRATLLAEVRRLREERDELKELLEQADRHYAEVVGEREGLRHGWKADYEAIPVLRGFITAADAEIAELKAKLAAVDGLTAVAAAATSFVEAEMAFDAESRCPGDRVTTAIDLYSRKVDAMNDLRLATIQFFTARVTPKEAPCTS
jgi:hypothetical protein